MTNESRRRRRKYQLDQRQQKVMDKTPNDSEEKESPKGKLEIDSKIRQPDAIVKHFVTNKKAARTEQNKVEMRALRNEKKASRRSTNGIATEQKSSPMTNDVTKLVPRSIGGNDDKAKKKVPKSMPVINEEKDKRRKPKWTPEKKEEVAKERLKALSLAAAEANAPKPKTEPIPSTSKQADAKLAEQPKQEPLAMTSQSQPVANKKVEGSGQFPKAQEQSKVGTTPPPPDVQRRRVPLLTAEEKALLDEYNDNVAYPNEGYYRYEKKRVIVIDGNDVARGTRKQGEFYVRHLRTMAAFFEHDGHNVRIVISGYESNIKKKLSVSDQNLLAKMEREGLIIHLQYKFANGRMYVFDYYRFLMQFASAVDGAIVSNSNLTSTVYETPAFKKMINNRIIKYKWIQNFVIVLKEPYGRFGPKLQEILHRP